ncbi:hypothetical protein I3842_14G030000 [Carya illinoinensis]|uniref:Pectinesterase n=1 Tax=Carya illinoinensis TaxID=32201 RepID=A0A922AGX4_CARIL|nr:hypothetical protein I3842_14G030000 [Carya illinoinensis]
MATTFLLLILAMAAIISCLQLELDQALLLQMAQTQVLQSKNFWVQTSLGRVLHGSKVANWKNHVRGGSFNDCARLYDESESLLSRLLPDHDESHYTEDDARTWLSGVLANHRSCLDGLDHHEKAGFIDQAEHHHDLCANFIVAKDGSGTHRTINAAVVALSRMEVYNEKVEIRWNMKNVMLVGDGIDKTIVTRVSGDGFWVRNITFENTTGPYKLRAVALRVSSDRAVFYRCSFRGYQDTLCVHSLRQFYRDCHIYGTIDFIFGDVTAVFQNCDIFLRRPMRHQANMITSQGRVDSNENTGIAIQGCRVRSARDLSAVKNSTFRTFLGRPWKKYSRTVFMKTDLDGSIDPEGWTEWRGNFSLSMLFFGEYMNTGIGASTQRRVPRDSSDLSRQSGIPVTGVPIWLGISGVLSTYNVT